MARLHYVKAARKDYPEHGIKKGEPYYWWKFAYGSKRFSKTAPKASQLTQSDYLGRIYDLQEAAADVPEFDSIEDQIDEIKGKLEELRDEQEEKRSNMPESLQDSGSGAILMERYDDLDCAISELESVDVSFDEPEQEDGESKEGFENRKEEEKSERASEIWSEVVDAISNLG